MGAYYPPVTDEPEVEPVHPLDEVIDVLAEGWAVSRFEAAERLVEAVLAPDPDDSAEVS